MICATLAEALLLVPASRASFVSAWAAPAWNAMPLVFGRRLLLGTSANVLRMAAKVEKRGAEASLRTTGGWCVRHRRNAKLCLVLRMLREPLKRDNCDC